MKAEVVAVALLKLPILQNSTLQNGLAQLISQSSPSLPQNSVSSLFRNSTLETAFRPFPYRASYDTLREFMTNSVMCPALSSSCAFRNNLARQIITLNNQINLAIMLVLKGVFQQLGVYPYTLGAGAWETKSKAGHARDR